MQPHRPDTERRTVRGIGAPVDRPLDLNPRLDRRRLLRLALAIGLGAVPAGSFLAACGGGDGMMGDGMGDSIMDGEMPDWMMSDGGMMGEGMMEDMRVIHALLTNHDRISRDVDDISAGIRARTTSDDAEIGELIGTHVGQMKARVDGGEAIRHMDPLFREIFEHHDEIEMEVERVDGGVLVVETSVDPQVELLIRQHAHRAVSEFVADGMARAMEPTPLPLGYTEG
jgi:hypothetical protein